MALHGLGRHEPRRGEHRCGGGTSQCHLVGVQERGFHEPQLIGERKVLPFGRRRDRDLHGCQLCHPRRLPLPRDRVGFALTTH